MNKKMVKYRLTNIKWDTDGDEEIANNLPAEVIVIADDEDDAIDKATDEVKFCIFSATVTEVKPKKGKGINTKAIVKVIEKDFEKYAIRPSYVAFVGNELRVGLACVKGGKDKGFFNGEEHMKHLVDVADMILFGVTYYTYDENEKHVFGKLQHDRPRKYEDCEGNIMLKTEFRCAVK